MYRYPANSDRRRSQSRLCGLKVLPAANVCKHGGGRCQRHEKPETPMLSQPQGRSEAMRMIGKVKIYESIEKDLLAQKCRGEDRDT